MGSGNGTCAADGVCACDGDFGGTNCDTDLCATEDCNTNGTCAKGACTCNQGFSGTKCETADPVDDCKTGTNASSGCTACEGTDNLTCKTCAADHSVIDN